MIGIAQAWRDFKAWKWFSPHHMADLAGHYFVRVSHVSRLDVV